MLLYVILSFFSHVINFFKVHLDVSPEESLQRIKLRGRDMEKNISIEYLTKLHEMYNEFLKEISTVIPVIKVNWSEFQDPKELANKIKEEMSEIQNIRLIDFK